MGRTQTMKFKYTIPYVDDVAATLDFFERAFGFRRKMLHESGDYGELDTGETTLSFTSRSLMKTLGKSPGRANPDAPVFEVAFETEDVEGALARAVAAGGKLVQTVREEPWGQTTAYISESNGLLVEICSPVRNAP